MKLLFEMLPVVVFFVAYKCYDIYVATVALLAMLTLQIAGQWLIQRTTNKASIIAWILTLILGGATLFFHNETFIKWKPTALYWVLAMGFYASSFFKGKILPKTLFAEFFSLPETIWRRVNTAFIWLFALMGTLNLYVADHYTTNVWVNYKLFGTTGMMLLFIFGLSLYMAKHMQEDDQGDSNEIASD